jgi:hypothetical protein
MNAIQAGESIFAGLPEQHIIAGRVTYERGPEE